MSSPYGYTARHDHLSNRAKTRSVLDRKPVFRSILQNPFQISWPSPPLNVQNVFLARLVAALENMSPRIHASRKSLQKTGVSDQQLDVDVTEEVTYGNIPANTSQNHASNLLNASHPVIGINAVTRALESQIRVTRKHIAVDPLAEDDQLLPRSTLSPIAIVFVCCADVDPSMLIDHIPHLVARCNTPGNVTEPIKLVPLPKGSELSISQVLGIRRAAVVAFRHGSPLSETVQDILDLVPIVSAPWFHFAQGPQQLVPTHVKQLRTSAPKDMRSAREERSTARAAAKRKASTSSRPMCRKSRVTLTTG